MKLFRIGREYVNLKAPELTANIAPTQEEGGEALAPPAPSVSPEELIEEVKKEAASILDKAREQASALHEQAESARQEAKAEAESLIADAQEKAESIRQQAKDEGLTEGKKELDQIIAQAREEDAKQLERLILEVGESREKLYAELEDEIVDLSLSIAQKIVNVALKKDDTIFESLLKNALSQMKREGKITIRVSESEYERFFSSGSATFVLGNESVSATIVNDPALREGGCIIESDGETVNASVDSQFKYLSIAFHNPVENEGGIDG